MKSKFLLLLLIPILISCSGDSSTDDSQDASTSNKIKKVEEIQNGVVIKTSEYEYNDLGNISKLTIKDNSKLYQTTFNYDSSNKMISWNLKESYLANPSDVIDQVNSLEYTNELITNICISRTEKEWDVLTNSIDRISYSYSDLGLTSIEHYIPITNSEAEDCSDVTEVGNEEFFEYSNGNLVSYEAPGTGFFSDEYYEIEYDNGRNYLSSVKPDAFRYAFGNQTSVNNRKKIYVYNSDDDKLTATVVFENTYDKNNNLVKAVEKYYYAGSTTPSNTTTMNYYYY